MTIAEIHGKISEVGANLSERMEDLLTADSFGCFRYLPYDKGLIPFLDTARSFHGHALVLPSEIAGVHYSFWPWVKLHGCTPCEPDVVIGLETDERHLHLVFVEAKYHSGLSSEEDEGESPNDQLARELDNLDRISPVNLHWSPDLTITSRTLLVVTQDMGMPRTLIAQSLAEYQRKRNRQGDVYWTSWRFLHAVQEKQIASEVNQEHRAVLEDMMLLLQRKWLTMFNGVEPVFCEFNESDFDFYHITSLRLNWPDLTVLKIIEYSYGRPKNKYEWPSMPTIKMNYEYGRR